MILIGIAFGIEFLCWLTKKDASVYVMGGIDQGSDWYIPLFLVKISLIAHALYVRTTMSSLLPLEAATVVQVVFCLLIILKRPYKSFLNNLCVVLIEATASVSMVFACSI